MELLQPTNDYVFKRLFGQKKNVALLKDLLQAILPDITIDELEVEQEVQLDTDIISDKVGRLDILAILKNGTKINIEMQIKNNYNTPDRSIFYTTKLYQGSLSNSQNYTEASKSIGIWILNYNEFNEGPIHEIIRFRRDFNNIIFTDKIEIHYIQLPKFREKCKRISNKLDEWLTFINNVNSEEIKMIDNENIKKAQEEIEYLSGDAAERRKAELRESYEMDKKFAIWHGIEQEKKEIAKKMKENNLDMDLIIKITGLSKEEIENL